MRTVRNNITSIIIATIAALTIAGCGSSSTNSSSVASCLKNALYNQQVGGHLGCKTANLAQDAAQGSGTRISVNCIHQHGPDYVCHVHTPADNLSGVTGGFYNVVYGAHSMDYQPTSSIGG